jgi:hypothetical protein
MDIREKWERVAVTEYVTEANAAKKQSFPLSPFVFRKISMMAKKRGKAAACALGKQIIPPKTGQEKTGSAAQR